MINDILTEFSWLLRQGTYLAPLIAFVSGFLTSLTPCSLSSIPLIIGYVNGVGERDTRKSFFISLVFVLGMTVTFTTIGLASALLNKAFNATGNWWYFLLGILMIMMAIQTWDIYYFIKPSSLINKSKKKGYIGALISGVLAGFFSSPCATPVMVALMSIVAASSTGLMWGSFLFLLFALGNSIVVLIAGTFVGFVGKISQNKSYGKFSRIAQLLMGGLIFALGVFFISEAL